jgi:tetratricopeptide (TPR) repeat protein
VILVLLGLAGALPGAAQATAAAGLAQADAFLAQADTALSAGNAALASSLAESAIELAPGDSEALFLRARLALSDQERTAASITDLRAAIAAGTWRRTPPDEASIALAGVLLRTGRVAEARALAEPLTRTEPQDYRPFLLLAQAQIAARNPAGDRTLGEAVNRFPLADEVRLASARRLESVGQRAAGLAVITTGLKIHPDSLPLLLAAAGLETPGRRGAAVEAYISKGGTDPLAPVVGMEASSRDRARYLDLFLGEGGLTRQDLTARAAAAAASSRDLSRRLQDALAGWSGNRDLDRNGDGFWEERWIYEKGAVTRWIREPQEDGVAAVSASFDAGSPASVTWTAGQGAAFAARYSEYPWLESATGPSGGTLVLQPRAVRFDLLAAAPSMPGLSPRMAASPVVPREAQLRAAAYRFEERGAGGSGLLRATILSRGIPVYAEEDTDGDGRIDHRVWYTDGSPSRGELILPEGTVVHETWRQGRIVLAESDTDGDGVVDYRETRGAGWIRSWDYNEDGTPDAREYEGTGGTRVRELSTRLNGTFDVRVIYRDDRIDSVTRAGARLAVLSDPARGVTWIGAAAPADARPDTTAPDGLQTIGGAEYLVFRSGGVLYAEATR